MEEEEESEQEEKEGEEEGTIPRTISSNGSHCLHVALVPALIGKCRKLIEKRLRETKKWGGKTKESAAPIQRDGGAGALANLKRDKWQQIKLEKRISGYVYISHDP